MNRLRTFLICAVMTLAAGWSLAQNTAVKVDHIYEISDFSGMLKSHISPYLIPKNAAGQALNVRGNTTFGGIAKRERMRTLSDCRASAVKSLHRYYKSDDTKYLIQTASTMMDYIDDSSGDCTALATGLSDSKRWSFVTYKDVAIGTNGTDNVKKWDGLTTTGTADGARTANDLITDLGAPFAELNAGTNLDNGAWYQYRVAFYDGSVYKYSTARSNPILNGAPNRDIRLTDIPLGPSGTTSRIIYRTEGQASRAAVVATSDFKRIATISDNSTRTYNDAISDATWAADSAPTWATVSAGTNVTPPKAKFALIHKDRLFLANDPSGAVSGRSTLDWSDILNPDYFNTASDYELIRPDDGDEITGIFNLYGILTIAKTNTWQKFYTDEATSTNWSISSPFSFVGCAAPYSAKNTISGIIYLGRHGLYIFNGQNSELISDSVTDVTRDILETNFNEVAGMYNNNQYFMAYTSDDAGSGFNDRVLVFDMVRNSYVLDTKNIDSWVAFEGVDDFGTLYSGSSATDGEVSAHSGSFIILNYRYKSQFEAGTRDSVVYGGTEDEPFVSLGWDETWATAAGVWSGQGSSTWQVEETPGYWYSPIVQVDAASLDKLFWNEELGSAGDVTWAVRTGASSGAVSAASWSSEFSNPAGSDISALTANTYIQFRAKLTTSDFSVTPYLVWENSFVMKMTYAKEGLTGETSVLSLWQSGMTDMEAGEYPKRIKEIQVYYEAADATLNLAFENDQGVGQNFDIVMSTDPDASTTDTYFGNDVENIFTWMPPVANVPVGRKWRFTITETGTNEWKINRIVVRTDVNNYVTFR